MLPEALWTIRSRGGLDGLCQVNGGQYVSKIDPDRQRECAQAPICPYQGKHQGNPLYFGLI